MTFSVTQILLTASGFANTLTGRKLAWLTAKEVICPRDMGSEIERILALPFRITHLESFRVQRLITSGAKCKPLTQNIQYLKLSSGGLRLTSDPSCKSSSWYLL
jgi:hypothetical protein